MIVQIPDITYITIGMVTDIWHSIAHIGKQAKELVGNMKERCSDDTYRYGTRADFPSGNRP